MKEDCSCGHAQSPASSGSNTQNHDFGGLDQSGGALAGLEAHFFRGVCSDDRSDVLFANRQSNLREQAAVLDIHHSADQLVAAADFAEIAASRTEIAAFEFLGNESVD